MLHHYYYTSFIYLFLENCSFVSKAGLLFFSRQKIEHFVAHHVYKEIGDLFDISNASILREIAR